MQHDRVPVQADHLRHHRGVRPDRAEQLAWRAVPRRDPQIGLGMGEGADALGGVGCVGGGGRHARCYARRRCRESAELSKNRLCDAHLAVYFGVTLSRLRARRRSMASGAPPAYRQLTETLP